jgi:hypothetical protein
MGLLSVIALKVAFAAYGADAYSFAITLCSLSILPRLIPGAGGLAQVPYLDFLLLAAIACVPAPALLLLLWIH